MNTRHTEQAESKCHRCKGTTVFFCVLADVEDVALGVVRTTPEDEDADHPLDGSACRSSFYGTTKLPVIAGLDQA